MSYLSLAGLVIVIVIVALILIYRRRQEDEHYLFLKLVGYYLLGSFRVNIQNFALPAGFIIFLAFFRPQINKATKGLAAYLGLAAFLIAVIFPQLTQSSLFASNKVPVSSLNIYTGFISKDWARISQEQDLPDDAKLENFEVDYNDDGLIREVKYEITGHKDGRLKHYWIQIIPDQKVYLISVSDADQWLQFDRLVNARRFFEVFGKLNLQKMKPTEQYDWYVFRCDGSKVSYDIKANKKFVIKDNMFSEMANAQLPVTGYYISSYGMLKVEDNASGQSYEGRDQSDYFFDVEENKTLSLNYILPLTDTGLAVYREFSRTKSNQILSRLSPTEICRLYFHAIKSGDPATQYALYVQGPQYPTPSYKQFLKDINSDKVGMQNTKLLILIVEQDVKFVRERFVNEQEAVIEILSKSGNPPLYFRMIKNNQGIWKVAWTPLQ